MKKVVVIVTVLCMFDSVVASIIDQQQEEFGTRRLVICSDLQFAQTFTAATDNGAFTWNYMPESGLTRAVKLPTDWLPVESDYNEDASFRTHIVPELQGAILMCFGGLFVLRNRKSANTSPS